MREFSAKLLYEALHASLDAVEDAMQVPVHISTICKWILEIWDDMATIDINQLCSGFSTEDV